MNAPRYGWVLNLDAEFELERPTYTPSDRLLEQLTHHGAAARALLGPDDLLVDLGVRTKAPPGLVGRAWCPTPRAIAALTRAGIEPEPHPDVTVLARVNHRRFAFELGGGLPGQRYVESRAEVEALLHAATSTLLMKRPLSFSGRGQLRAYGGTLDEKQWSWVTASLRRGGLLVEPFVTPTREFGLHGYVSSDGARELGRVCTQTVSDRGVFRGARLAEDSELSPTERSLLLSQGERVSEALHGAGYFGPFGIDAYRYESEQGDGFCSLGEINARYTMGFAVGFLGRIT